MKSKFNKIPGLPKLILLITGFIFIFSSCQKNRFDKLIGRVYYHEDSIFQMTAGFDKDTIYYIMKDSLRPLFHRSKYKSKKIDDSTYLLELTDKPKFWEKNSWEIIVRDDKGFVSKESKRYYRLYSDTLFFQNVF
ncbi:MAG: hypothetical protein ABIY50_06120 [Ignavibacteria bacterium]